jgi:hypothetical protein
VLLHCLKRCRLSARQYHSLHHLLLLHLLLMLLWLLCWLVLQQERLQQLLRCCLTTSNSLRTQCSQKQLLH